MPHTIEKTVYKFDELDLHAKERAREHYRSMACSDEWWEDTYEDAIQIANILGIKIRQRTVKFCYGGTKTEPAIYFSGFFSQGDGACFEGSYSYKKDCAKEIKEYAPQDAELLRIAIALQCVQYCAAYGLSATIKHRGHYNHSGCMEVDVSMVEVTGNDGVVLEAAEKEVTKCLRDFADWIYKRLEAEHDYLNADEQIEESIKTSDPDFYEDGSLVD